MTKMVTVYHRTTPEAARAIEAMGRFKSREGNDVFVSNRTGGHTTGYGDTVVTLQVPSAWLRLDDAFPDGEEHYVLDKRRLTRAHIVLSQPGHATKKKTSKQLDAEIADILAGPTVGSGAFKPGQRVKCSYRGDHVGRVLSIDDPRAWAKTLAFPQDKPARRDVKEHLLRHPTVAVKSIPVMYKFGVQWDHRDCLAPI